MKQMFVAPIVGFLILIVGFLAMLGVLRDHSFDLVSAQSRGLRNISCVVAVSTATTVQAVGGDCVAPGAAYRINITDVSFGTSAAAGVAADSFPTLKKGTGGTCGAATAVIWQALTGANSTVVDNFQTPVRLGLNEEVCWIMTTVGSKTIQVYGFISQ